MIRFSARAKSVLHVSMLLLLVLGVLVRPALNFVGEIHGAAHAAEVASEHGHGHPGDGHDADHDQDHASGTHLLMHQADSGSSSGLLTSFRLPPVVVAASPRLQWTPVSSLPQRLSSPFRPPIA